MADALDRLIISVFEEGVRRDIAAADQVRAEIKQRGTYWAADEIWKLRRRVTSLQRRVAELEARQ